MKRLAVVTTHPVQYYAPVFKLLAGRKNIDLMVFYTWGDAALKKQDPGFGKEISWDIPLLDGYSWEWVVNKAADPGSHHFKGIVNPGLISRIKAWQADAVLVIGWAYDSHLKVLRYFKNKLPVLFRGDSTLLDEKPVLKSAARYIALRWIYKHLDYALYPGSNNKSYFKKYGLKDDQLVFAPHAVDNERFAAENDADVVQLRSNLNIDAADILILFAGKFEEKKDPVLLLNSFINLNSNSSHLLFTGNGPLEKELKEKAAGHKKIHFLPFQNQRAMPTVYQACDLFCLPSKGPGETWGMAVNEAMAAGKAVLVSNKVGCAPDLITPGVNGFIFDAGNLNSLTDCLRQLTGSKMLLQQFGINSAKSIADWNMEKIAAAIEQII
jgi:glycosyltransferase involved in cell wall biosynthesis